MATSPRLLLGVSVLWVPLAFLFDGVTVLMLPVRLGADATTIGVVSLAGLGLAAGLQPVAGWLSDRHRVRVDRRSFLIVAAVPALAGLWLLAGSAGVVAAVVGYVVLQTGATAIQAAQQTLIPEHLADAAHGRAAGLKAAFDVGGAFLAFVVLGALLGSGDLVPAALVVTLLVILAVVLVTRLVPPAPVRVSQARWSLAMPAGLAPLIGARFLFLLGTYAVGRFLVLLVAERLSIPLDRAVADAGWMLALFTLAAAAAAVPFGWLADRRPRRELMVAGSSLAAIGILLLVPSAGVVGVLAGGALMSLGTAGFVTANWAATTALVPAHEAGRLMAMANLGTGLAAAAAGLLGPVIDAGGFAPALLIAASASACAILPLAGLGFREHAPRENAT